MFDKTRADYSLYLVTDRGLSLGRSTLEVVEAAVAGGVTMVQLREKSLSTHDFFTEGMAIRDFLRTRGIPLIVNDRLDIAQAIGADGVHLGQDDLPLPVARKILGPEAIIGGSVNTPDEALRAVEEGADYLGLSPIFVTETKPELHEPIGVAGIRAFRAVVDVPLVGIGSMNAETAYNAVRAGLDGIAVVSAICSQPDVTSASTRLMDELKCARQEIF